MKTLLSISVSGLVFMLALPLSTPAQVRYFTRTGVVSLDAEGIMDDLEEIKATTSTASCVIDVTSGKMEWAVLMKSFQFKNALMQDHFNENYVESSKYPKATYAGTIENPGAISWDKNGVYPVKITGNMTLHGITKPLQAQGTITVAGGEIKASSDFKLVLADYNVQIPSLVSSKVASIVAIKVQAALTKL